MSTECATVLVGMQSYLLGIATNVVSTSYPDADREDVLSEINVYLLERSEIDPHFLQQTRAYIARAAAWHAAHWLRHHYTCVRNGNRVTRQDYIGDLALADLPFYDDAGQRDLQIGLAQFLDALDGRKRRIVDLRMQGYSNREIARSEGITPQAVGHVLATLRSDFRRIVLDGA
jgi:RNA polymerase sigma factor (sigma-70 family)